MFINCRGMCSCHLYAVKIDWVSWITRVRERYKSTLLLYLILYLKALSQRLKIVIFIYSGSGTTLVGPTHWSVGSWQGLIATDHISFLRHLLYSRHRQWLFLLWFLNNLNRCLSIILLNYWYFWSIHWNLAFDCTHDPGQRNLDILFDSIIDWRLIGLLWQMISGHGGMLPCCRTAGGPSTLHKYDLNKFKPQLQEVSDYREPSEQLRQFYFYYVKNWGID